MQLKTLKLHKVKRSKPLIYLLLLLALCKTEGKAQDVLPLTERVFLKQVLLYHPRLMSEELEVERAKQNIQVARAAFDPVWKSEFKAKEFEGKDYYDYQHSSFSWQAPPGIQFKAGVDRNRGDFVNPEFSTPAEGLAFAEIAIPLGDGLFRTEDQTKLQKSRIAAEQAIVQLEVLSRGVIYSSSELFWNWIASQRELTVRQEIAELAETRYNQTKTRFEQGMATGMDTLEARTQWLQRSGDVLSTSQMLEAWYRLLGNMIWDEALFRSYSNMQLKSDTTWESSLNDQLTQNRSPLLNPMLNVVDLQRRAALLDRALARERLKPDLQFSAKALSSQGAYSLSGNSTQFGFSAYFPLISRKERATLKIAEIRLNQLQLQLLRQERELIQQYDQLTNQLDFLRQEEQIALENVANASELLRMENKRLLFGESTLLLVNIRESNYIASQLKLIDLKRKRRLLEWRRALLTYSPEELLFN